MRPDRGLMGGGFRGRHRPDLDGVDHWLALCVRFPSPALSGRPAGGARGHGQRL